MTPYKASTRTPCAPHLRANPSQHAVALLLAFIGAKIALDVLFGVVVPTRVVLLVILGTLGGAMLGSVCATRLSKLKLHLVAPKGKPQEEVV